MEGKNMCLGSMLLSLQSVILTPFSKPLSLVSLTLKFLLNTYRKHHKSKKNSNKQKTTNKQSLQKKSTKYILFLKGLFFCTAITVFILFLPCSCTLRVYDVLSQESY